MKWSNDDMEHIAPLLETTITHTQKWVANSYDTYEQIHNSNNDKGMYKISQPLEPEVLQQPQEKEVPKALAREEDIEVLDIDNDLWKGEFTQKDYN